MPAKTEMSERLEDAIWFAAHAHAGQVRKLANTPYILHPMEVAAIIGSVTDDEDVIIAGLLHDTVEDCGISFKEIRDRFGERVCALVKSETEEKRAHIAKEQTWQIRKEESLEVLKNATDPGVKILWLGDKLSNIRSFFREHEKSGNDVFNAMHQKDPKKHAWYYHTVGEYLKDLSDTAAYREYTYLVKKVFDEDKGD